ncbi:unnamed protein product, partial [Cyprideis torosa]
QHNLFPQLSVRDNVALGIDAALRLNADQWARVDAALEDAGLGALAGRLPSTLSGGQAQRAALVRILLRDQPILLLDEPFSALDAPLRQSMMESVCAAHRALGACSILVTHDLEAVRERVDRVLVMDQHQVSASFRAYAQSD